MKKTYKILIAFFVSIFTIFPTIAKDNKINLVLYNTTNFFVGEMANYSTCSIGAGIGAELTFPFFPLLGISCCTEVDSMVGLKADINTWTNTNFSFGTYINFPLSKVIILQPELRYGVQLHLVNSQNKTLSGMFLDQLIQISGKIKFSSQFLQSKGFYFNFVPVYTLLTEKTNAIHYLGFRLGISYQL